MSDRPVKRYLFASEFDQTLTFNDSGYVLSARLGIPPLTLWSFDRCGGLGITTWWLPVRRGIETGTCPTGGPRRS